MAIDVVADPLLTKFSFLHNMNKMNCTKESYRARYICTKCIVPLGNIILYKFYKLCGRRWNFALHSDWFDPLCSVPLRLRGYGIASECKKGGGQRII